MSLQTYTYENAGEISRDGLAGRRLTIRPAPKEPSVQVADTIVLIGVPGSLGGVDLLLDSLPYRSST